MTILAIDQGTTSTRALRVDADGVASVILALPHRQIYPRTGWVEHDPEELLGNVRRCLNAAADLPGVLAVGIDNQGESCLAWDGETGRPVSPVLVWQDDRTQADTDRLRAEGCEPMVRARTGLPLDPYFSASKLGWILREIPEARRLHAAGRLRLGTTDAFFLDRLAGRFVTDVTTASRTSLMDLSTCRWDAELCRLFGVPVDALPEIVPTTGDLGLLACGGRRVPLAASVVDQQASLYGHGARAAGGAKITFGTGAFCLAVTGHEVPVADGPLPTVAWQKAGEAPTYALDGGVYCASSAVDWARGLGLFAGYDGIGDFGDRPPAIARGLAFVPALAGLACPHWNRAARGAWLGLSLDTAPSDMMQALLEGVALRTAEVVAAMGAVRPLSDPISVDGGMTANPYFLVILADVLGRTIAVSGQPELTAVGTAALAADAIGRPFPLPRPSVAVAPSGCDTAGWTATFSAARRAVESFGR